MFIDRFGDTNPFSTLKLRTESANYTTLYLHEWQHLFQARWLAIFPNSSQGSCLVSKDWREHCDHSNETSLAVLLHGTKPKKTEKPRTRGIPRPSPIEIFAFQYQFLQNEI